MSQVLVTVPSRVLLEQLADELTGFCKVGTGYNDQIDMEARGFLAVTDSVQLLKNLKFEAAFIDEAHHPMPKGMPSCKGLFKFSATHKEEIDFRYSLGEAIEQGVLCDYDLTVPVTTAGHPYICLANLLLTQAGRFRRVLAYCNSIAEAKRFQRVLKIVGLAAWHINGGTNRRERGRVMRQFSGELTRPVHVLVTVQVLGEGVNIPNADTCMFVEPRSSYVSIIQAIGRVLRLHLSKPLAHVVLPALAVPRKAGALLALANSDGSQHSSDAPARANAEVAKVSTSSSMLESVKLESSETDVGAEVPLQLDLEPHMTEVSAMQLRRNSPRAFPGSKAVDGQAGASKDVGQWSIATGGQSERQQTEQHQPARLAGSRADQAGQLLVPAAQLRAEIDSHEWAAGKPNEAELSRSGARLGGDPGLHTPFVSAQAAAVYSSEERPSASLAVLKSGPDGSNLRAETAGTLQKLSLRDAGLPIKDVSQSRESQMIPWSDTRNHRIGSNIGTPKPPPKSRFRDSVSGDAKFFGSRYAQQLGRFLGVIARTDSRYAQMDAVYLQSRLWVTDCSLNKNLSLHPLVCSAQNQLALILQNRDPWDSHLQAVEQFAQQHNRLPSQRCSMPQERFLGRWLGNQGYLLRRERLSATRVQKLVSSPCSIMRARALQWLDPSTARASFEKRLEELERFVQAHGRLPQYRGPVLGESGLGIWLQSICHMQKRHRLSAARMQKLLNSSQSFIRARAKRWLDPSTIFSLRVEELQRFVREHDRMPQCVATSPVGESKLAKSLADLVRPGLKTSTRTRRLQFLEKLDPIVAKWVRSRQARASSTKKRPWKRYVLRLLDFVKTNHRLPCQQQGERDLFLWLCKQRRQLDVLPAELQETLCNSHPIIASFLQLGKSGSQR